MSPYRVTPEAVLERKAELDEILSLGSVAFKTNEPARLRYRLHEALHAAKHLSMEPYASLSVKISVQGDRVVVTPATRHEIVVSRLEQPLVATASEQQSFDDTTMFQVVETVRNNPHLFVLHFPSFSGDVTPVKNFAEARGYEVLTEPSLVLLRRLD